MVEDLVSIITPSYNSARFISDTIYSVQNQTYSNWELLIVDDYSIDDSVVIINKFIKFDDRIKLFCLNSNVGAAAARNLALDNAKGRYIAFLDSDDLWEKDKLEKQLNFISTHNYAFIFSTYGIIDEKGNSLNKIISSVQSIDYNQYLRNTIIGCLTVLIDRKKTGDFKMPLIRSGQDMALWLEIMKRGFKAYGMNECLAFYRIVSTSLSSNKIKKLTYIWRIYKNIEKLSFFQSSYLIFFFFLNALKKRF